VLIGNPVVDRLYQTKIAKALDIDLFYRIILGKLFNQNQNSTVRMERMPDVTNDERGRRIFQIHKERAVETALEKVRRNIGPDWAAFSQQEIKTLTYILGETWVSVERRIWEQSAFTRLTRNDLGEIISIGNDVNDKKIREEEAINKICRILNRSR
jgi:hypothetical protein